MASLLLNKWGNWAVPRAVFKNIGGVWYPCSKVHHNLGGAWTKHWPPDPPPTAPGYMLYDVPGSYWWVVPWDITYLSIDYIWGGGGGAGACYSDGDAWIGSGGGSGGWLGPWGVAVTPGQILRIDVGQVGWGASYRFNGNYVFNFDSNGNPVQFIAGVAGGQSGIFDNTTGAELVRVEGGQPGIQYGFGGVGGNPNGQPGGRGSSPDYLGYGWIGPIYGGRNPAPVGGNGGDGRLGPGTNGQPGRVSFSYG
jgi:hypothetical protein